MSPRHIDFVQKFHAEMYKRGYVYEKTAPQLYCEKCGRFLPDRYVEGTCPFCKREAKGDSCEHCGKILEPEELLEPKCLLCGSTPVTRDQTQLYLKLSALQKKLRRFFNRREKRWTAGARGLTKRYLNEGLCDRAITRSLEWGVPLPPMPDPQKWEGKRIYIWAENVLGYLSASERGFIRRGPRRLHYYVHGKDNIPFHSLILPGLILAHGGGRARYHLPDIIDASEYVTIGGQKLSKSRGVLIPAHTLYENFDVDMVRYFFLRTVSDKRDSNFSAEEFVNIINGELVNNFGNLVNRVLTFVISKFGGVVPPEKLSRDITRATKKRTKEVHRLMMQGRTAPALKAAMDLVNTGNGHFAAGRPWATGDKKCVTETVFIIKTAAELLEPFIPFGAGKVRGWLAKDKLEQVEVLYERLDPAKASVLF
jgi:methionyl-tRNA synthetase